MQAIQQPDEITVPSDDFASPSRTCNLIIMMLEHKHAFLFGEQGHNDGLFHPAACPATTKRSVQNRVGSLLERFSAAIARGSKRIGRTHGASICPKEVTSPSSPGRLSWCERGLTGFSWSRLANRSCGECGGRAARWRYRRLLVGAVSVTIRLGTNIARLVTICLCRLGAVVVAFVNIWSVPWIVLVIH